MYEWDEMLRSSTGEDWPSMLGRLNAAMVRRAWLRAAFIRNNCSDQKLVVACEYVIFDV